MAGHVSALYRYPVKGLSADTLDRITLAPGQTIPFDRAYAIENGPGRFNEEAPQHLPKINFLMLMRDGRLATLRTRFEEATETLEIERGGRLVAKGQLSTKVGRIIIEQFMAAFMQGSLRGPPRIVRAPGHSFSDVSAKCLHLVNLATVRDLERTTGRPINPLRFRPNIIIDGPEPWAELSWVGRDMTAGGVRLRVLKRTDRCAATNVDPETGERNMDIPAVLARKWGHMDFGVYVSVVEGGSLTRGDAIALNT